MTSISQSSKGLDSQIYTDSRLAVGLCCRRFDLTSQDNIPMICILQDATGLNISFCWSGIDQLDCSDLAEFDPPIIVGEPEAGLRIAERAISVEALPSGITDFELLSMFPELDSPEEVLE